MTCATWEKLKLRERLPQIYELAVEYLGVDPAHAPIPVLPAVHYTMGGIMADGRTASPLPGLYSVGECSSVGIHGANRLGSNSLTELLVFGKVAGVEAARYAQARHPTATPTAAGASPKMREARALELLDRTARAARSASRRCGSEMAAEHGGRLRYLSHAARTMQATCDKLARVQAALPACAGSTTTRSAWNTEWLLAIELGYLLDVAQAMAHSALERRESRGSHQRLDGFEQRDDADFLKHTLAFYARRRAPRIGYGPVKITRSQPGTRAYGAAGEAVPTRAEELRMAEPQAIEIRVLRYRPEQDEQPVVAELRRAVHATTCRCCRVCNTSRTSSTAR